jgi:hypothetical protein
LITLDASPEPHTSRVLCETGRPNGYKGNAFVICAIHYLSTNLIIGARPLPEVLHVVENISRRFVFGLSLAWVMVRADIDFASFLGKLLESFFHLLRFAPLPVSLLRVIL